LAIDSVEAEKLDLSSLRSVSECAKRLLEKEEKIDLLVHSGGIATWTSRAWKTEDGFDAQLGINHLGHFLLTKMLLPLMKQSAAGGFHPRQVQYTRSGSIQK
jgi:NAD(P)-dependent dehydrogenase (short-subunit alcohol dehydrogenase family)